MSELTARLAIYGSIDRRVVEDRLPIEVVARYLAPYGTDFDETAPAAGWYVALVDLLGSSDDPTMTLSADPDPDAAIAEMADESELAPIDAEHRLRALFLADRLLDELDTSPGSAFVSALQGVVAAGADPDDEAARPDDGAAVPEDAAWRLAKMLGDRERFPDGASYDDLAAEAHTAGLLSSTTAALAAVTCDEGTAWFPVPGTTDHDVAAVVISKVPPVPAVECPVSDLRLRFHPGRWPACLPTFWGAMDPLAPPAPNGPSPNIDPDTSLFVYREHVGDQRSNSQWFTPVLDFWYEELTVGPPATAEVNGFAICYRVAQSLPPGVTQDPRILVDDGYMEVRRSSATNGTMTVTAKTSKTLAMREPLPSAGLAIFACASGWADQAKALVTGCLLNP